MCKPKSRIRQLMELHYPTDEFTYYGTQPDHIDSEDCWCCPDLISVNDYDEEDEDGAYYLVVHRRVHVH